MNPRHPHSHRAMSHETTSVTARGRKYTRRSHHHCPWQAARPNDAKWAASAYFHPHSFSRDLLMLKGRSAGMLLDLLENRLESPEQ